MSGCQTSGGEKPEGWNRNETTKPADRQAPSKICDEGTVSKDDAQWSVQGGGEGERKIRVMKEIKTTATRETGRRRSPTTQLKWVQVRERERVKEDG